LPIWLKERVKCLGWFRLVVVLHGLNASPQGHERGQKRKRDTKKAEKASVSKKTYENWLDALLRSTGVLRAVLLLKDIHRLWAAREDGIEEEFCKYVTPPPPHSAPTSILLAVPRLCPSGLAKTTTLAALVSGGGSCVVRNLAFGDSVSGAMAPLPWQIRIVLGAAVQKDRYLNASADSEAVGVRSPEFCSDKRSRLGVLSFEIMYSAITRSMYKLLESPRNTKEEGMRMAIANLLGVMADKYNRVIGVCKGAKKLHAIADSASHATLQTPCMRDFPCDISRKARAIVRTCRTLSEMLRLDLPAHGAHVSTTQSVIL
jgi:hypothetical protein